LRESTDHTLDFSGRAAGRGNNAERLVAQSGLGLDAQRQAVMSYLDGGRWTLVAANVRPIIEEIMRAGATSHNAIAAKLNERNVRTARGGVWTHVQVGAILHPFAGASVALA
jgi:hypothetical protein